MKVPIGYGSSPDGGGFWATEDKIFWASGSVSENKENGMHFRISFEGEPEDVERQMIDYSKWSDEKRAEVLAESKRRREAQEAYWAEVVAKRNALRASARLKLTEDEIEACDLQDDSER